MNYIQYMKPGGNFWLNLGDAVKYAHSTSALDGGGAYYVISQVKEDLREQGKEDEARKIEKAEAIGTVGGAIAGVAITALPTFILTMKWLGTPLGKTLLGNIGKDMLVGTAGYLATDEASKAMTGKTVGQQVADGLGKIGLEKIPYSVREGIGNFANPGGWLTWGGGSNVANYLYMQGKNLIGKGILYVTPYAKSAILASKLNRLIRNTKLPQSQLNVTELHPHSRVKVGDVEVNDPNLAYRQVGESIAKEFPITGRQIPTMAESGYGIERAAKPTGIILGKVPFKNPMYAQGRLWYGIPQEKSTLSGLLVTNQPLLYANMTANPVNMPNIITSKDGLVTRVFDPNSNLFSVGTRRIPSPGLLNSTNTSSYIYEPGYGYRKAFTQLPKTSLAFFEKLPTKTSSASVSPITNIKLTSHLQGDDAAQMFNEYANGYTLPTTETENVRLLRAYVAEARERYGLVGNDKVSDETILKALYKHVDELGGNTAARNIDGEPQLLFRGDTRSYTELKPRVSPEELITMGGTMDNSLGTLFLGELPGTGIKGQGLERYLVHGREFNGNKQLIGSGTGAHVVSPTSGDKISEFDAVASFPYGSRHLVTHTTSKGIPHSYYKLPAIYSSTGVNDINGFVVRTPNMRNASKEISVLNDDLLVQASSDKVSYYGPKIRVLLDKDEFPLLVDEYGNVGGDALAGPSERAAVAQHYRHVLDDAKLHNQGLLKSEGGSTNGIPGNYLREEHSNFNYFALPNFNLQNAKHILPYDFRIPRDWSDPNIFKIVVPTVLTLGGAGTAAYNISNSQPLYQKQGGSIHIKKKNLGSFTRNCKGKVTEECIRKGKNSSNPTTRKRANFAWVARHKFKHEDGGKLNYLNYFN